MSDKAPSDEAVEAAVEVLDGKFIDELDKQQALAHWREPVTEALQAALPFLLADEREARLTPEEAEAVTAVLGKVSVGPSAQFPEPLESAYSKLRTQARSSLGSPEEADR